MSYALTGLLVGVVVMVVTITIALVVGQRELGRHRGIPRDEFIRAFAGTKIPDAIPAAVYDYYKSGVISKEFSVAPADTYEDILHEGEEEILDDIRSLTKQLGLTMPPQDALMQLITGIKTLRDMVVWLDSVGRR